MWIEAILILIIAALVVWIAFFGGGTLHTQRLVSELRNVRGEINRLQDVNEALRANLDAARAERTRLFSELCIIAGELEQMKAALEGSRSTRKNLKQKYDAELGPELLERILVSTPKIDLPIKWRLAHEILVGEIGKALMNSLNSGAPIPKAAAKANVPVVVARNKIRTLQMLGYLDNRLRLTEFGREALL